MKCAAEGSGRQCKQKGRRCRSATHLVEHLDASRYAHGSYLGLLHHRVLTTTALFQATATFAQQKAPSLVLTSIIPSHSAVASSVPVYGLSHVAVS